MKEQKQILITGGPTNEPIDEVMKITNMSTGSLSVQLGGYFLKAGYKVCLVLNNSVSLGHLNDTAEAKSNLRVLRVETTEEMMKCLEEQSKTDKYHGLIHAAAVGDYLAEYTFLMEDLAEVLWKKIESGGIKSREELLAALCDKESYAIDNSSKISSYQKNLTVKLGLTPKIIANLRAWYPGALLVGCKLLENVPKEELFEVAEHLCVKNKMDYILANDLADLRNGKPARYLVNGQGFTGRCLETPGEIAEWMDSLLR